MSGFVIGSVCVGVGWGRCTLFPLKYSEMSHLVGLLPAAHEHEPIRIVGIIVSLEEVSRKVTERIFFFLFRPKTIAHRWPRFSRCQIYWRSKYNLRDLISYYLVACVCIMKCQIN